MTIKILALVGSLRAGSFNRQLAEAAVKLAPEGIDVQIYENLGDLPFYNEDLDQPASVPVAASALRDAGRSADALLAVTPEYNGTVPAVLKNAIDWMSRPHHRAVIEKKPLAVIGTAAGRFGGRWAHDDTRKTARIAGAAVLDDIALSVPRADSRFASTHPVCDDEIAAALPVILDTLSESARSNRKDLT